MLEQSRISSTPVINNDQVTFVWYGETRPQLIGDFNYWSNERPPIDFERVAPDTWQVSLTLPPDAYLEYSLMVDGKRMPDPLNPNQTVEGMGHINSYFWMPQAKDSPFASVRDTIPHGTLTTHTINTQGYVLGTERTLYLYHSPTSEPTPLLIVFDGMGYIQQSKLLTIVDNLIADHRMRPVSIALIDPGGMGRTVEYACSDTTVAFLIYCLLPAARQHLNLIDKPGSFGMMGASMGGLMSLYTAFRAPEIFGHVLSQSGAFRGDFLFYRSVIHDLITYLPRRDIRVWMDVGLHEWFIDSNREMFSLLTEKGYDVTYSEHTSGHNYPSWRRNLEHGLTHLFPPVHS